VNTLVLVHGAGSGPWVFDEWDVPGGVALDLHAGLEVARATMADYARRVAAAVEAAPGPVGIVGWSMGGLVAMMAATAAPPAALVVVEPSAPAEVQGSNPEVPLRPGTFDPEAAYGRFPPGMGARPESLLARAERKRGISVPSITCRMLVVYGADYAEERGRPVAERYGADEREFPDLGHFELITSPVVRAAILEWLG
jgi:pimeloyl-ACP methyl ester carboxylesterase